MTPARTTISLLVVLITTAASATAQQPLVRTADASLRGKAVPDLAVPFQVHAGGQPIDTSKLIGYSGPTVMDHDGDGRHDLLVGSFSGRIQVFRNTGTNPSPEYDQAAFMQAEGADIEISNW